MSYQQNFLRTIEFKDPEYIPCNISVMWPLWNFHRKKLEKLALKHSLIFQGFKEGSIKYSKRRGLVRSNKILTDPFGCVWSFRIKGYEGQVIVHPLHKWKSFRQYKFPNPEEGIPETGSAKLRPLGSFLAALDKARERGESIIQASMPHGFFFQRLYYLRGFTSLLKDFIAKPPQIYDLIESLTEYYLTLIDILLDSGRLNIFYFGDDLGLQNRMPISPETFREFIFPTYYKIFQKIRSKGVHVYLHTDGHIIEVIDQLIESGVDILNIQDRVNGINKIAVKCKNIICINLDIDRQYITAFGKPVQIRNHIKNIVKTLSSTRGGLIIQSELHPPTPLKNIEALVEAMEENMWLS
jgi:hypothetical protein